MTDGHDHAPAQHADAPPPFTAAEVTAFRNADVSAGRAIVVLMQGIFLIGLFLYLIVAWSVM